MERPYMTPDTRELLAVLMSAGVRLGRNGEKLTLAVPENFLTQAMNERIVAHRLELLAWLAYIEQCKRLEHDGGAQ